MGHVRRRYCMLCGWDTPSWAVYVRMKVETERWKRVTVGWMCQLCGKVYAQAFPVLYLLKDDAEKVKTGERKIIDYQPQPKVPEKVPPWTEIPYSDYD